MTILLPANFDWSIKSCDKTPCDINGKVWKRYEIDYCENAKKVIVKIQIEKKGGGGGQCGCEQRIEVIVKMQRKEEKKSGGWVRVDAKKKLGRGRSPR